MLEVRSEGGDQNAAVMKRIGYVRWSAIDALGRGRPRRGTLCPGGGGSVLGCIPERIRQTFPAAANFNAGQADGLVLQVRACIRGVNSGCECGTT